MSLQQFIQEKLRVEAEPSAAHKVAVSKAPVTTASPMPSPMAVKAFQETVALNSRRTAYAQKLMRG